MHRRLVDMPSVFTMIIAGELPGTFVWTDDHCVAIMSINPISHGHTLVIPRQETDQWIDLTPELREHLFNVAHKIAVAQKTAFQVDRIGLVIAGFEVPHTHLHLIPADTMSHMDFQNAASAVAPSELAAAAESIRAAILQ
tara:strand:+ start:97 stop:516 length:420 start_codon:yes stop_codon:yes gene_type:complete